MRAPCCLLCVVRGVCGWLWVVRCVWFVVGSRSCACLFVELLFVACRRLFGVFGLTFVIRCSLLVARCLLFVACCV